MTTQHDQVVDSQIKYTIHRADLALNCEINKKRKQLSFCDRNRRTQQKNVLKMLKILKILKIIIIKSIIK